MKKITGIAVTIISLLIIIMGIMYIAAVKSEIPINDDVRSKLSGSYIKIDQGVIHYNWHGPKNGPVLVMVHGFSTPQFVFDKNVPALVKAGFRVLAFDHFGRGYSDRPDAKYDENFFDKEMIDLFKALKITKPVYLFGYSLGGGISTVFTARHPEKVKKLILGAPVGFLDKPSGKNALLMIPVLGEFLFGTIGKKIMINQFKEEEKQGIATKRMVNLYGEQFNYKGARNAMLSTMRNYPMDNLKKYYEKVGLSKKPIMFIWGKEDETVPYRGAKMVSRYIPHIKKVIIEKGTHSIVYSHPKIVNDSMIKFIKK